MLRHRWMGCCMTSCPPPGSFTGTVLHLPFLQTLLMHGSSVSGHTTGSCQHRPSSHQSSVQSSPSSQWFCKFGFVFRACYVLDTFVVGPLFVKARASVAKMPDTMATIGGPMLPWRPSCNVKDTKAKPRGRVTKLVVPKCVPTVHRTNQRVPFRKWQ